MNQPDYYWTTVKQLKLGAKFKLHPDYDQEYIRGHYDRSRRQYECEYKKPCFVSWLFLDGSEVVCVMKEVTE